MKFMKLGSRPDTFYTTEAVRSISSDVSSDLIVQVKSSRYLLHKFPLLSKSLRLQKLCAESPEASNLQIIQLPDFPGGAEAFELCAKFCYGIKITLSARNLVSIRCAAEHLQMTEEVEKGNLIYKIEIFFTSCILHGWRDSILTLQTTKALPAWSEELGITSRCIDAIASKILAHPIKVSLSSSRAGGNSYCNGPGDHGHKENKGWWAEDLAELGTDLYWRTMVVIKSGGSVSPNLIGDALRIYASRWLPNVPKYWTQAEASHDSKEDVMLKYRLLLESIVSLLPAEKGQVACSFLMKLLKAANLMKASATSRAELASRIGLQLDEASVSDLLIPPPPSGSASTKYDVDVVLKILDQFMSQGKSPETSPQRGKSGSYSNRRRSRSAENVDMMLQESRRSSSASHGSKLKVAKLIDGYLQKIADDPNLSLSKFIAIAESVPVFARLVHDDLYKAIDIFLKVHPELNKSERKRLCRILNCRKLSVEASMHAAQNETLPLRVVVQVLFLEQTRAAMAGASVTETPTNIKASFASKTEISVCTSSVSSLQKSNLSTLKMKLEEEDEEVEFDTVSQRVKSSAKGPGGAPARPRGMLCRMWSINRKKQP